MDTSLGASSVNDLIGMFEGWEKVQELSEQLSGVRAQLLDAQGKVIAGRDALPAFCRLVQSSKIGEARCRQCYEKHSLSSEAAKKRMTVFTCHAGLENIAFPLSIDGTPAGAIICGRALHPKTRPDDRALQNLAAELSINIHDAELAVSTLNAVDSADLTAYAKVLQPFIDNLGATIFRYFTLIEKSEDLITAAKDSDKCLSVDRLTGLFNRRYFDTRLESEVSRAIRYRHPLTLILLELDDFDRQTDGYGIVIKDFVLKEAAEEIINSARQAEVAVRYDDDRFAIIMPECDHEQAFRLAERIRKNIAIRSFCKDENLDVQLTVSFGVSAMYEGMSAEKLIEKAEQMLVQAKSEGGNKIRLNPMQGVVARDSKTPYIYVPNTTKKRRVVITGLGPVAPNGIGKEAFWTSTKNGKSGVNEIKRFDASDLPVRIAGEVNDFQPSCFISQKDVRRMDRFSQMAVSAASLALQDSELDLSKTNRERVGVSIGSAIGGASFAEEQAALFRKDGHKRLSPFTILSLFPGAASSQVSQSLGVNAVSVTTSTGCPAGADALAYAYESIIKGETDVMIAGGAESPLLPAALAAFAVAGALSKRNDAPEEASRPFDLQRDGFVLSEGAGVIILEEYEHASKRGAKIYCELLGYGMTCDAYHMTRPAPDGDQAKRAMEMAVKNAGVSITDIDYINAHGSSTPLNDVVESRTIKRVFGDHASHLLINSTKSMIGHSMGGAGPLEFIATALSVYEDYVHPTINYENPDPDCDLDYVPNIGRNIEINNALSSSFGFGGKNTVLAVSKLNNGHEKN